MENDSESEENSATIVVFNRGKITGMVGKVELIPISDGNRITIKQNEKVIVGRGSSLGCNEKRISRHHAELLLKDDNTLWITPTHANPVFYRPPDGKTIQLAKDVQRELKDGDHIGLLPSSFFFRISFAIDVNNNNENNDSDADSLYGWKKEEKFSPTHEPSPDRWSPSPGFRRLTSNQDISVFDFDDDIIIEPMPPSSRRISLERKSISDIESSQPPCKRPSLEKKTMVDLEPIQSEASSKRSSLDTKSIADVEPTEAPSECPSSEKKAMADVEPSQTPSECPSLEEKMDTDTDSKSSILASFPTISLRRISVPSPSAEDQDNDEPEEVDKNDKTRKLPKWMGKLTPSPVVKHTPKPSYSRNSSYNASTSAKRALSFEGEGNDDTNELSNMSDIRSPATTSETKSPGKILSRIPAAAKSFDSGDDADFDSVRPKSPPPTKKRRSGGKRRPACQFGASCYRKNPVHRAEQSHPGDSDYEGSKQISTMDSDNDNNDEKPDCPFGKACYRQNPQHKRDFKH